MITFNKLKKFIKSNDNFLILFCLLASAYGLLMVMSATKHVTSNGWISRSFIVMTAAILLGFTAAIIISYVDYKIFLNMKIYIAAICLIFMILLFFIGTGPASRPDAKTWLNLGFFYFQPSELLKVGFIITFAAHLEAVGENINKSKELALLGVHAVIPILLVAITGDLGSALVFILISAVMLFISGIHWGYIIGGTVLLGLSTPLIWKFGLKQLQKDRILALLHPEKYPNIIYQQKYGMQAIGSGGVFGKGLFKGVFTQNGLVPESENDMIFSCIGEELGFIGGTAAIIILLIIVLRIIYIGKKSTENATNFICQGVAAMILSQIIVNIGMCLMLLPVIGITLPFFSSGGSSNLCIYLAIGLVLSIYKHNFDSGEQRVRVYEVFN